MQVLIIVKNLRKYTKNMIKTNYDKYKYLNTVRSEDNKAAKWVQSEKHIEKQQS